MKKTLLLFVLLFSLTGCKNEVIYVPDIKGEIEEISNDSVLIDSTGDVKGLVWVYITDYTVCTSGECDTNNFTIGDTLQIVSTGDIRESSPMQADAKIIVD
ncbi:hypothetical protein RJG79_00280 [Mycoplasmatota bacterium WC44]